jgi:dynein heavy chain
LPLEAYDDKEFDTRRGSDWMQEQIDNVAKGEGKFVSGQGLWKDKDGLCYWRKVKITKFLPKSERYEGYWENTKEKCRLHRIHMLFDAEDPRIFVRRFKQAYTSRIYADSLIKYNYYVENMPTHQIPEIDNEQVNRVLGMT